MLSQRASVRPGSLLKDARRGIANSRIVRRNDVPKGEKTTPLPSPIDAGASPALAVCGGAIVVAIGMTFYTYRTA